jgi:RNA polymerase sigma-70 factor (ECF subfamily)
MDEMSPPRSESRLTSRPPPDLGVIFDEHFDYVWATLRRLGVRDADREDLVHEVFLKVHARLADYDTSRPLRPWLFGFAYRVAADHRRLARHRVEVLSGPGDALAVVTPADEGMVANDERALVLDALDTLDLARRAVLVMHDVDDVPIPAVAAALEIPLNTAYSRLRLARRDLAGAVTRLRASRAALPARGAR